MREIALGFLARIAHLQVDFHPWVDGRQTVDGIDAAEFLDPKSEAACQLDRGRREHWARAAVTRYCDQHNQPPPQLGTSIDEVPAEVQPAAHLDGRREPGTVSPALESEAGDACASGPADSPQGLPCSAIDADVSAAPTGRAAHSSQGE